MKPLLRLLSLILLLSSITLFNSCEKEQDIMPAEHVELTDLIKEGVSENLVIQESLKKDIHYINYMNARAELYDQLSNFNIDILGIVDYQQRNRIQSICEIDQSVLMTFQGGLLYQKLFCQDIKENFIRVHTKFEKEIAKMTNEEVQIAFAYKPNNANMRVPSCLDLFNNIINAGAEICSDVENTWWHSTEYCLEDYYNTAGLLYDMCCADGGSGCPPGIGLAPQEEQYAPADRTNEGGN